MDQNLVLVIGRAFDGVDEELDDFGVLGVGVDQSQGVKGSSMGIVFWVGCVPRQVGSQDFHGSGVIAFVDDSEGSDRGEVGPMRSLGDPFEVFDEEALVGSSSLEHGVCDDD